MIAERQPKWKNVLPLPLVCGAYSNVVKDGRAAKSYFQEKADRAGIGGQEMEVLGIEIQISWKTERPMQLIENLTLKRSET